ncbi:MAG: ribbon-helix-helix protein, CopG family [Armatimonadetes bacterium]|nr:ribbon-helix-helix protein, CopG family [Armatimonadota bacterium]
MTRTQVYLTEGERDRLAAEARRTGTNQSALIREAVDLYLDTRDRDKSRDALLAAAGLWRHRTDLPDFDALRREFDRDRRP